MWKKMEICKKCIPYFRRTWYNIREGKVARNASCFAVTCAEPAGENFHTAQYSNTIIRRKEEYYDREDQ